MKSDVRESINIANSDICVLRDLLLDQTATSMSSSVSTIHERMDNTSLRNASQQRVKLMTG